MDCDTYALWVYYNNLEMGMGQQHATDQYQHEHARCTGAGGDSEYTVELDNKK